MLKTLETKGINRADIYAIISLIVIVTIMLFISWHKWLHPIIDCGREVYIPWCISNGAILYKDLAYFYGPFAAYFIALIFKIAGAHLNVVYFLGITTNILLLGTLYFLGRQLLSPFITLLTLVIFIQIGPIAPNLGSYEGFIYPYSFAALFGLLFSIVQLSLIIYYFRYRQSAELLYLSAFFASLAITCKQDYALSALIITLLFSVYLFKKQLALSKIISYWVITLIIPVFSYGIFFLLVPANELINNYLIPGYILSSEHSQTLVVSFFSFYHILISLKNFIFTGVIILILMCLFYLIIWLLSDMFTIYTNKFKEKINVKLLYILLFAGGFFVLIEFFSIIYKHFAYLDLNLNHIHYISWYPLFLTVVIVYYLYKVFIKKITMPETDLIFLIIAIAGGIISIRAYAYCFTSYLLMPMLLAMVYLLVIKAPEALKPVKFINQQTLKYSACSVIIFFILLFGTKHYIVFSQEIYPVETAHGSFKTFKPYAMGYNSILPFIDNNVAKEDKFTVFPEETLINFLTQHPSPTKMSQFMDINNIMMTPEEYKLNTRLLKESKYIFISNFPYFLAQKYYFGVNYRQQLGQWIKEHYNLIAMAGQYELHYNEADQTYGFLVFKRKD